MKFALDLTSMPDKPGGVGVYIENLAKALLKLNAPEELLLIGSAKTLERIGVDGNSSRAVAEPSGGRAGRLAWEQAILPSLLRKRKADVLHSPHYTAPFFAPTNSVVTFHDMTFFLYPDLHTVAKRTIFPAVMRITANRSTKIIASSESTRRDLIAILLVDPRKVVTVELAAGDLYRPTSFSDTSSVCRKHGLRPGQYLLFVGVFEPRKNIPTLISAFAGLAETYPELQLALVGKPGWMYEEIFTRAKQLNLANRVEFLGYVADADLPALYTGARALLFRSLYEGFGLPVLEALQCGTPVVTSNISSMAEIAGDAALLVDPWDPQDLRNATARILSSRELSRELSRKGLERARSFSWKRCAASTLDVYREAALSGLSRG
jgi:Glycosyltransferase